MLTLSAALALIGLFFSATWGIGKGNPFSIFFGIWSAVTVGALITEDTFYRPAREFWGLIALLMLVYLICMRLAADLAARSHPINEAQPPEYRERLVLLGQWVSAAALPLIYLSASSIAGESVFTSAGYVALRTAFTRDGVSYGALGYFMTLSFVVASIRLSQLFDRRTSVFNVIMAVGVAAAMSYLTTGRAFFMMLFCFLLFPLVVRGKITMKGITLSAALLGVSFVIVAMLTGKGLSPDASLEENLEGAAGILRVYFMSPVFAMGSVFDAHDPSTMGEYTFRFFYALGNAFGMDNTVVPLIREFVDIPDSTNVFTVMDPYYRDFGVWGVMGFAVLSSIFHMALYEAARKRGGPYVFIYAATMFALVMQFFQDMYMSLLSTWIQVAFLYVLLVRMRQRHAPAERKLESAKPGADEFPKPA
jgi:oligosaccharide repeat unit polymerase